MDFLLSHLLSFTSKISHLGSFTYIEPLAKLAILSTFHHRTCHIVCEIFFLEGEVVVFLHGYTRYVLRSKILRWLYGGEF